MAINEQVMFELNKRIKCPSCGTILDVRNSKNEAEKIITCPQCKAMLKVRFKQLSQEPVEAPTYLPNAHSSSSSYRSNDGETQYGEAWNSGKTELGGVYGDGASTKLATNISPTQKSAYLQVNGRDYHLNIGTNIVGRKSVSSNATLQLETSDRYMSRQHAKIIVTRLPGGQLKSVISNDRNKNISTIDGQDLLQGDEIVLADGDRIVMGKTTVTYREL